MNSRLSPLILLLFIPGFVTLDRLFLTSSLKSICAVKGTEVQLKCSYSNINIKTVFWFSEKQSTNWRKTNEPEDLTLDSDYSGRVNQTVRNDHSTLTISDVRERDSGEYRLVFIKNDGVKHLSSEAVNLTVTDLHVRMNPASTTQRNQGLKLACDTSCTLSSDQYYWMKNGQYLSNRRERNLFVSPSRDAGSFSCSHDRNLKHRSSSVCVSQRGCWDVSYSSRRVCALVGSTVDISSTYSHPSAYTVNKTFWHYGQSGVFKDVREEHQFAGRVEYVENKLRIKHLRISDSGKYRFRIIGNTTRGKYSGSPVILTVTDAQVTSSPGIISERQEAILSCSTNCTLKDKHIYIWFKNGRQVTDGFTKDNKLYLDSVSNEELQQYSCAVGDPTVQTASNPEANTALLSTLVILSVFLFLTFIGVLWIRRRKHTSPQQHEDNKGSAQSGSAMVYDNATVCTQQVHTKDEDVHYSTINFKQSDTKNISFDPTVEQSTTDDVHYAAVKFS